MATCTELCKRLKAIDATLAFSSYDELISQLQFSEDDCDRGRLLGSWHELQRRKECGFCQLAVSAISEEAKARGTQPICPPGQPIRVLILPGEHSFRLSFPSLLGTRLALVAGDDRSQVHKPDTARRIGRDGIDIPRIKAWLQTCDGKHEACSTLWWLNWGFNHTTNLHNFRLIDLESGCVKLAPLNTKYAALSYVWGQFPTFRLVKNNFQQLSTARGLNGIREHLPKTVSDAMDLVSAIGMRYLWVDGLCLIQDDDDDVNIGVNMMDTIYSGSYFTIVAGSGADANAGLPWLNANPDHERRTQIVHNIAPGLDMTVLHSIDWHLDRSIYTKRGWTLQEVVLPRRTLIFIAGKVYLRCQEANWSEETWADQCMQWLDDDDMNISRIPGSRDGMLPSLWAYQKLCEDYSRRKLSNDGDAIRALAGILRPLAAGMETSMAEGVPGYYLDHFLLFISSGGNMRRRPQFASFSWAGWEGGVMWPRENFVRRDANEKLTSEAANILNYFRFCRVVRLHSLDDSGHLETLSADRPEGSQSFLLELLREYAHLFPNIEEDPERQQSQKRWSRNRGSDLPLWHPTSETNLHQFESFFRLNGKVSDADMLHYDPSYEFSNMTSDDSELKMQPIPSSSSQKSPLKYDRLSRVLSRIDDSFAWSGFSNVMTASMLREMKLPQHPHWEYQRPDYAQRVWHFYQDGEEDMYQSRFRKPIVAVGEKTGHHRVEDIRVECGKEWAERRIADETYASKHLPEISDFPPYTVLQFVTVSMHFILGPMPVRVQSEGQPAEGITYAQTDDKNSSRSRFHRIKGISLLSSTGQVAGSLHPDNIDLLPAQGSKVECIIVSRCSQPTVGSALLDQAPIGTNQQWKLFWVLCIVCKNGIAERRGVGQVLSSAMEMAVEPKPEVKLILLG